MCADVVRPEDVAVTTADGVRLEAELRIPARAWAAAVLAHPHPRYGGDMRSIVIAALFETLPASGVAVVRFNFRGVGRSGGAYGGGSAERADVVAAVDALAGAAAGVPLVLAGWSFGADVSLAVGDDRVAGWLAVAPPLQVLSPDAFVAAADPRPTVVAVPQYDQVRPPESAREFVAGWTATRLEVIPGADHFLAGRTDRVAALALELLENLAP